MTATVASGAPPRATRDTRRAALALLWRAAEGDRPRALRAAAWLVLAGGIDALGPILGKAFIDDHVLTGRLSAASMTMLLGGVVLAGGLAALLRYGQLVTLARLSMRAVQRLRERVFGHVLGLPMAFFDRAITGQLVSRITNDTEAVKSLYVQVLFNFLQGFTVLLGAVAAMAWLDWRLMLIVLTLVPAVLAIVWGYQRLSSGAVQRSRELRSDINAQMAESIGGMGVLQATGAAARFAGRFGATNAAHYDARIAELRANAWLLRPALDLVNVLLIVAVVAVFDAQRIAGAEVGILYAFVAYIARVGEPLIQITMQFSLLQQSMVAAARVNALLDEAQAAVAPETGEVTAGALALSQVRFGYDPARPVLHDLTLAIPAGSFHAIVGHTGSGKSTLLSLLLRFYVPQAGRITVDGTPLQALGEARFRAAVGLVPQEPFLLAGSARENIDMGRGLTAAAIEAAARAARVHEVIVQLPQGYDTPLGEGGARLSSGQKQLVAVARALAGAPRILFLDEATSRIDSETEHAVQQALAALRGRVTVVAIAHRLSTIRDADTITVLGHGRIAEQGTHATLMAHDGGIYQRLYQLQQLAPISADDP
jgi:ATP-binding cassette subfamily B protein/ATP-binding cassette subfamily C protein/ATP-binding cassette subfamily B multidrug efflux pump